MQANFPFPCLLQRSIEVEGAQTGLHVVGKMHLCLLHLIPTVQNARAFPVAKLASRLNMLSASCATCVSVGKERGHGRTSALLIGWQPENKISCLTETKSLPLVKRKCYFP